MARILVVGGGAAGMMASAVAAEQGHKVVLFEQNEKLGKKIYITGQMPAIWTHCISPW